VKSSVLLQRGEILKVIGELKKSRQVEGISQHAIICGYGRIGQILAQDLATYGFPFVVVDMQDERLAMAEASGYLFVKGSATEEETLIRAGAERAASPGYGFSPKIPSTFSSHIDGSEFEPQSSDYRPGRAA